MNRQDGGFGKGLGQGAGLGIGLGCLGPIMACVTLLVLGVLFTVGMVGGCGLFLSRALSGSSSPSAPSVPSPDPRQAHQAFDAAVQRINRPGYDTHRLGDYRGPGPVVITHGWKKAPAAQQDALARALGQAWLESCRRAGYANESDMPPLRVEDENGDLAATWNAASGLRVYR